MFDKLKQIGELKKLRDEAMKMKQQLAGESIEVEEDGIRVVISGDQQIKVFEVQGVSNSKVVAVLNKAIERSQKMAAQQLQNMSGGLGGLLKQ
jgi:DNA-binding protein YbaB